MRWDVWQEIFDRYEEPQVIELDDENGQSVDIDLLDTVKSAIVCRNVEGVHDWIGETEYEHLFSQICLDPEPRAWNLNIELTTFIRESLLRRAAEITFCEVTGLGTTSLAAKLKGHYIKIEYRCVDEEETRCMWIDEEEHDLGNNSRAELNRLLDEIQPKVLPAEELNFRPTLQDEEAQVDTSIFDALILEDDEK